jgi:hypothetical protein
MSSDAMRDPASPDDNRPLTSPPASGRRIPGWVFFSGTLALVVVAVIIMWAAQQPMTAGFVQHYGRGDRGTLRSAGLYYSGHGVGFDDTGQIPMIVFMEDYPEAFEALCGPQRLPTKGRGAHGFYSPRILHDTGRLFFAHPGDHIEVVESGTVCVSVRLLDGTTKGAIGWVRAEHCKIELTHKD